MILQKVGISKPDIVDNGEKAALAASQQAYDCIFMVRNRCSAV